MGQKNGKTLMYSICNIHSFIHSFIVENVIVSGFDIVPYRDNVIPFVKYAQTYSMHFRLRSEINT